MLIVTADDFGRSQRETDAVLECYSARRVSTTSAMVFMQGSKRAADLARPSGMPVGLHLNLSEPFTQSDIQPELRQRHSRVCRFLRSSKYALVLYNPLLVADFVAVVEAQLVEFHRLYGCAPSHIDGHQHMHLATNVLVQRLLPAGMRVRRSFSFSAGEKSLLNRLYRARVDSVLAKRHRLVDFFFSLSSCLKGEAFQRVASLAQTNVVEVMTHPARESEFRFLTGDDFDATKICSNEELTAFSVGTVS